MVFRWQLLGLLAAVPLLMAGIACGDDDDDDDEPTTGAASAASGSPTGAGGDEDHDSAEATVRAAIDAYNAGDADGFWGHMTDAGVASFLEGFGLPTDDLEAAKAEAAAFIGENPLEVQELDTTDEGDDEATVEAFSATAGIIEGDVFELVKEGEEWKIDAVQLFGASPEVPDGYETIDLGLVEFAFEMETEGIEAGELAFAVANEGDQPHEAFLVSLAEGVVLEEALQSEEPPEGVDEVGGVFNVEPGASYNLVFTEPLEPGRYAFICFFPNTAEGPEGTPHAFLGMTTEFTVE